RASLLFLNYPNNPTAAMADEDRFREALEWCRTQGIVLAHDAAYSEITFGRRAAALFPVARGSGVPYIEFFSFSKTLSITGWRIGFAIGSPDVISALATVKANLDSGVFGAVQEAVADVCENHFESIASRMQAVYRERRDALVPSLERAGLSFTVPDATFYFWIRTPRGQDSIGFCRLLLEETGIVSTPGVGFGDHGEGFFRLSITTDIDTIRAAGQRLEARSA
ncbi:MAG TPA: aminotransferase class I/II-fold pyridoxal phosphate-dependent enzyme, partial [Patescibacteria group bacterium]|nr:aminotransferase class I/II-fold pyridoxal phosphate-dependent enzyme [Patescibacteria group bacterium]